MDVRRTIFKKEIITEFAVPEKQTNKVIIFVTGMPGTPRKEDSVSFYADKGFWAFAPRYRGSWESKGEFLKDDPTKDITDVIDSLSKGFTDLWTGEKFVIQDPEVYILGASFGGPAALFLSSHPKVKYAFANAPVIDWRVDSKVEPMDKLGTFIQRAFGEGYRFSMKNWKRLAKGLFYNPISDLSRIDPQKVTIFHAIDDDIVSVKPLREFQKITGVEVHYLPSGGHFGTGRFTESRWFRYVLAVTRGKHPKKW